MPDHTTAAYDRLLEDAARIAGTEPVDAVHLALAMLDDPESELTVTLQRKMDVDVNAVATQLRWVLDRPKPGPGQHGVAHFDGTFEIRDDGTLEVVRTWKPAD